MSDIPDVDIEVLHRDTVVKLFPEAHPATNKVGNRLKAHISGLYFQDVPVDPDGLAALPYDLAEEKGFYKIDLLAAPTPYDEIASMHELRNWLDEPIDWRWFTNISFVSTLFQLGHTTYWKNNAFATAEIVSYYAPQSIEDLASMIAIIRPGKKYLIGADWTLIRENIWKPEKLHYFKKSHAIAYALVVGLHAKRTAPEFFRDD